MQRTQPRIRPKARKKISKIDKSKSQLLDELSMWDRKMSEFYHDLEKRTCYDMYRGYLRLKELENIVTERRKVKNALHRLKCERHITIKKEKHRNVVLY